MKKLSKYHRILCTILGLFLAPLCYGQTALMSIAQMDSSMAQEAKPILILLSTDWCKYCRMQKNQLLRNKDFRARASQFYYVEFDAESKEKVYFHRQEFEYSSSARMHGLAIALNGSGQLSFPTWILLDKDYQVLFRHKGVLSFKQLEELLGAVDKLN